MILFSLTQKTPQLHHHREKRTISGATLCLTPPVPPSPATSRSPSRSPGPQPAPLLRLPSRPWLVPASRFFFPLQIKVSTELFPCFHFPTSRSLLTVLGLQPGFSAAALRSRDALHVTKLKRKCQPSSYLPSQKNSTSFIMFSPLDLHYLRITGHVARLPLWFYSPSPWLLILLWLIFNVESP